MKTKIKLNIFNDLLKIKQYRDKPSVSSLVHENINIVCYNYDGFMRTYPGFIVGLLERLPINHYSGIKEIIYDPTLYNEVPSSEKGYVELNFGLYSESANSIIMGDTGDAGEFKGTFYHEIGHYIHHSGAGTGFKLIDWLKLSNHSQKHITPYASKNAYEDFSECYECYIINPEKLMLKAPEKYEFIKRLFNNSEFRGQDDQHVWEA